LPGNQSLGEVAKESLELTKAVPGKGCQCYRNLSLRIGMVYTKFVLTGSGEGMIRSLNNPEFQPKNFGVG
jgi:hypothetical protein